VTVVVRGAPAIPTSLPPPTLTSLREVLASADYTEAGIAAALGRPAGGIGFQAEDVPLLRRRMTAGAVNSQLATLIKLFVLGCPLSRAEVTAALQPVEVADLQELLVRTDDGSIWSPLRFTPYEGFVFAHDPHWPVPVPSDYVMGIGPATRTLAGVTVRQPVERALDVGTGCGAQALLAARHAERVSAVELNPRGVHLARLNAAMNGIHNVEVFEGSLFEPVAGMDFDLVVSNPPYVISPDSTYVFRDSGRAGDSMSRTVVEQAGRVLRDGGFAHVLCNWGRRGAQDWWAPLVDWVADSGCDAWLLHYHSQDPLAYAAQWHAELQSTDPVAYGDALDRWLDYYRRTGTELIASGVVILRRRQAAGGNWIRWDEMPRAPTGTGSRHVERVFAAYDALAKLATDDALLAETFQLVTGHQLTQRLVYGDDGYAIADATIALLEGVGLEAAVPAAVLPVLLRVDGERPLAALIDEVAGETGMVATELRGSVVETVRQLFTRGLLARATANES
jgi:methylase of polypeptide subunit release factors